MSIFSVAGDAAMNRLRYDPMPSALPCLVLAAFLMPCGLVTAQSPAPSPSAQEGPLPKDLAALLDRVDAAHHPNGKVPPITAFRAALEVHLVDPQAQQGGQVDLAVQYMKWQRSESSVRHLIRYEVKHGGEPIERGRDENGMWQRLQGEPKDIPKTDPESRAACERDTNLARQLTSFLDPAAVLRTMTDTTPVTEELFRRGREDGVPCLTVEGTLPAFPLLRLQGEDPAVRLKAYVTKADGRLLALLVRPIADGKPDETKAELVRLSELEVHDGVLAPNRLEHFYRTPEGKLALQSFVVISRLELAPKLTVKDFDRLTGAGSGRK